jgi:hypothetical protein
MVSFSVNNLDNLVIIRSYPLNVYRTGPGPRTAKRTEGLKILRSFQKSFNASMAAADVIEKMSKDGKGLFSLASTKKWETRLHRSNSRRSGEI